MRELSVYYCPECGYYAYYQLVQNAICPEHNIAMNRLDIPFKDFINYDCEIRDDLISTAMLNSAPSLIRSIVNRDRRYNTRYYIGVLSKRIETLEDENTKLKDTVEWMHRTIWNMIKERKNHNTDRQKPNS